MMMTKIQLETPRFQSTDLFEETRFLHAGRGATQRLVPL